MLDITKYKEHAYKNIKTYRVPTLEYLKSQLLYFNTFMLQVIFNSTLNMFYRFIYYYQVLNSRLYETSIIFLLFNVCLSILSFD